MGARRENSPRSFVCCSMDQPKRKNITNSIVGVLGPYALGSSSAFTLGTIKSVPTTIPVDRAGVNADSHPCSHSHSASQSRQQDISTSGVYFSS